MTAARPTGLADVETVTVLDGALAQARGVIGRYPDSNEAYAFPFETVAERAVHMVGVRRPLLVEWWIGETRIAAETLRPWVGHASHRANLVVERRPPQ